MGSARDIIRSIAAFGPTSPHARFASLSPVTDVRMETLIHVVIYVFAVLFALLAVGLLLGFYRSRHPGMSGDGGHLHRGGRRCCWLPALVAARRGTHSHVGGATHGARTARRAGLLAGSRPGLLRA